MAAGLSFAPRPGGPDATAESPAETESTGYPAR
jgi:hypothetical protein